MSDTTAGDEREALVAVIMSSFAAATVAARAEGFADAILAAGWRRDGVDPGALRAIQRDLGSFIETGDGDEFDLIDAYGVAFKRIFALLDTAPAAGHETGAQT